MKRYAKKRTEQGFTVFQSEPIGAGFDFTDGITQADMDGLADYDNKFLTIAKYGFVHANAEFFFPAYMSVFINNNGGYTDSFTQVKIGKEKVKFYEISSRVKTQLERISRYWVARYGAFPVMWTLGQEIDDDFYWNDDNHPEWGCINNPYKLVADYISKYDCYDHPLTAHQENAEGTLAYGSGVGAADKRRVYKKSSNASVFRDVEAHNWYAAQWGPSKNKQLDFSVPMDYWFNSQGKPAVNYEGLYCGLWTKNFGSRMQGWCAYLNGLYGYGWGGHDTWSYTNTFDEEKDSFDGVDIITSQEKIDATWQDSLEYASSYQCGYMAKFLKENKWYTLIPRFENKAYFVPGIDAFYSCASNEDNSRIVFYFYSFSEPSIAQQPNADKRGAASTGTVGNLERRGSYTYTWFNPITGEYSEKIGFTSTVFGTYYIGQKPATDMVLLIEKA